MPKYLLEGRYTVEGAKGVAKEGGTGRRAAVAKMAEGLGGKLEALYYAFGDVDVYVIVDMPDAAAATAAALAANQSGAVAIKTIVLITPEEVDEAAKKVVTYRRRATSRDRPRLSLLVERAGVKRVAPHLVPNIRSPASPRPGTI
jgi:uncharacterized protein with GYD domain